MRTIQINNKHYQECDVVMLQSKNPSCYWLEDNGKITTYKHPQRLGSGGTPIEFYILSNEEIKEGDNFYSVFKGEKRILKFNNQVIPFRKDKKVIATTDSLKTGEKYYPQFTIDKLVIEYNLPQITEKFINYFIEQFNRGNVITKVSVEVELYCKDINYKNIKTDCNCPCSEKYNCGYKIKLNQNNEITILTEQKQYSKEELEGFDCFKKFVKQETLEESATKYANKKGSIPTTELEDTIFKQGFIDGFEKACEIVGKEMYTKEQVKSLFAKYQYDYAQWVTRMENDMNGKPIPTKWIKENLK
jgi:hypothetical protein